MFRHPHYLEVPWDIHWHHESARRHRRLWWVIAFVVVLAVFLIGVGVTNGIM
jgi:hypothetical protein